MSTTSRASEPMQFCKTFGGTAGIESAGDTHMLMANCLAGFRRNGHIKVPPERNWGLLWGEPRTRNLQSPEVSTGQERRTASLPLWKGAVAAGVTSTRRPAIPWQGRASAEPASTSPDEIQDATASTVSQISNSRINAARYQTGEVSRDTNEPESRDNRDELVKKRLQEDTRSTAGCLPAHVGLQRTSTGCEELGICPVQAGRHVHGDNDVPPEREEQSAKRAAPSGPPHLMHLRCR